MSRLQQLIDSFQLGVAQISNSLLMDKNKKDIKIKKEKSNQSKNIELVFSYLDELIEKKDKQKNKIGYKK